MINFHFLQYVYFEPRHKKTFVLHKLKMVWSFEIENLVFYFKPGIVSS